MFSMFLLAIMFLLAMLVAMLITWMWGSGA